MPVNTEKKAAYLREYYQKNKERLTKRRKEYYEKNKERIAKRKKEYRDKNKERTKEYDKEYRKTPQGKKTHTISTWKYIGLVCDDYDNLYDKFLTSTHCEECGVEYGKIGDGTGTFRCMDHCHITGEFRNFLCSKCNLNRR